MEPLYVLSFGGGQDSTAILVMLLNDPKFRAKYAPGHLLVVMSDTGDEHQETYEHVAKMAALCLPYDDVDFHFITKDQGYHIPSWPSLRENMERNDSIMGTGFNKSCTDKLKIGPIYKYIEHYLGQRYGWKTGNKRAYYTYAEHFGPLQVMIGIAKGEEKRVAKKVKLAPWMLRNVERVYPLIYEGLDRSACQEVIAAYGVEVPIPSNCMLCPFLSKQELVYLHRFHRAHFDYWVIREAAKLAKCQGQARNLGVFGVKTIEQTLAIAQAEYGHWSDTQLREYKMSHGHCVASVY